MNFIGRTEEVKKLNSFINLDEFSFSLIFGRRRIGKSELIKYAIKEKKAIRIYYECKEVSELSNVSALADVLSEELALPKFSFNNMEALLKYIFELSKSQKIILVLDEYPYLKNTIEGIDSILQSLIDKYKNDSKLSLVILGSYVDIMRSLLLHSNPLYGRVDLTIELKPMNYYESSLFYPNYSYEDKIRIYSVFGGIPYYNRLIDDSKTVKQNIIDLIASNGARLENEVSMYLNSEISKIVNANEVFEALSRGYSKYSDLLSQSHVSSGPTLIDVLDKLIRMDVVCKVSPINDSFNKKKCGYYISDNLSLFYYKYIFRYSSQIKIMSADAFYDKYINKDFEEQYVPHIFERICTQYLIKQNKLGLINPIFDNIGKYYYDNPKEHKNGEFDIVTKDCFGYIFYEAKFKKDKITKKDIDEEIQQVNLTGLNCYKYVFISKSGFSCVSYDNVELITLDQLFK